MINVHVQSCGLMSYRPNVPDMFRRAAELVDKILRGTKPGDIPVEQPTKFDFAKAARLGCFSSVLALADQVIK
jgi:putative tryptophan/tyrosine transport system substrate-binding protein